MTSRSRIAVRRVVRRIGDHHRTAMRIRGAARIRDRTRVVHAGDHHLRDVAAGTRRIDRPCRVVETVESAPLVGVDAADFLAREIPEGHRRVGHGELLAELRRERIELGGEVIGDRAGEVAGDVRGGEDIELRERRHLVLEHDLLAIAKRPRRTRERRGLFCAWEQAVEVRNDAIGADAGPEDLD